MLKKLRSYLHALRPLSSLSVSKPLVLFQSDDWGLVGIRDQTGFDALRRSGIPLGSHPYDFYSLETADDLHRLFDVLLRHRDSIGRPPCFVFNFVLANVDFPATVRSGFRRLEMVSLDEGFPGQWHRPGLLEAYREGIQCGLIYPAFHGLTHFSQGCVKQIIQGSDESSRLLRTLYIADTPAIYSRTPWVDFEYRDLSGENRSCWLEGGKQRKLVSEGKKLFERIFGMPPASACAPGYRANPDTWQAWADEGLRIGQNGPGLSLAPFFGKEGLLHLYRNVPFEPAIDPHRYNEHDAIKKAEEAWRLGQPAIICMHSLNFHSTLKNYRDTTLVYLDHFLSLIEQRYESLLYVHDHDFWNIVQKHELEWKGQRATVHVTKHLQPSPQLQYHLSNRALSGSTS